MKKPLLLVGGGGHCKSCIDVIEKEGNYSIEGIIDTIEKIGTQTLGYKVIADDNSLNEYVAQGYFFLITIGQIKSSKKRRELYNSLAKRKANFATIISPTATVSRYAQIGKGTIVMHGVHVNAGASVGENVILNTGCLIEHDTRVGDHVHISTHAVLNGAAVVEDGCFIGSNSVLNHEVKIEKEVIVGSGSVVVSNILEPGVYAGCPARKLIK